MLFTCGPFGESSRARGECSKRCTQQGRRRFGARSVLIVREHGNGPTCLREAATAKAGNAADAPFDYAQGMLFPHSPCQKGWGYGNKSDCQVQSCEEGVRSWPLHVQFVGRNAWQGIMSVMRTIEPNGSFDPIFKVSER